VLHGARAAAAAQRHPADLATLSPSAIDGDKIRLTQGKTGRDLVLDITPMLREVLDATDLGKKTILRTAYGKPSPRSH
jgi:hypothetical protein